MKNLWLIANSMSSTTEASVIEQVREAITGQGVTVSRMIDLAEEALPDLGPDNGPDLGDPPPDIIASLGGDGTAHAVIDACAGGESAPLLLILPGGTMNLLAAKLHGDADILQVIEAAFGTGGDVRCLPQIEGPDFHSLVGLIAGSTTQWGDVREDIRKGEIGALVEDVPAALEATFSGARVRLRGQESEYAALFVEPQDDGLHVHDIVAENMADLARHGWAWLNRDFLGGPTEELAQRHEITLESDDPDITLLVDGEPVPATSPLMLRWGACRARFIATLRG